MCTFTVLRSGNDSIVTMNRDERRERTEPGLLHVENKRVYPLDSRSEGTWFGLNDDGLVLAILNRYQQPHLPDRLSRGGIIPLALAEPSPLKWLSGMDASGYNPFDLFCVSNRQAWHFQWNGKDSAEGYVQGKVETAQGFMFSSSLYMTDEVLAYRQALFRQWLASQQENGTVEEPQAMAQSVLSDFHCRQEPGRATHAVLMERELSHTKSITQAMLSEKGSTLAYFPDVLLHGLENGQYLSMRKG